MTCHSVGNGKIIPTDELIFFRGVGIPPTSYRFDAYTLVTMQLTTDLHIFRIDPPDYGVV